MWLYLPISSQFLCEQGSEEHCSAAIRRHSDVSVIAGGMIGFSRAGRLSVLLERWHPSGGGGLYEWLRKARVCTLLVGTESVTRSRSDITLAKWWPVNIKGTDTSVIRSSSCSQRHWTSSYHDHKSMIILAWIWLTAYVKVKKKEKV